MGQEYTADDIQSLSVGEAIRMRPRLYFEKCFAEKSLDSLPFEVLCHAFDEYFDGVCKQVDISLRPDAFTVSYNAGMNMETDADGVSKAERIMTHLYAYKNDKKHLAVGEAFCSLGMAIINFASEKCELKTVCTGKRGSFVFEDGITVSATIGEVANENEFTEIFVKPNRLLFEGLNFTVDGINEKARELRSKLPGLEIIIHQDSEPV